MEQSFRLTVQDVTPENLQEKFEAAVETLEKAMGTKRRVDAEADTGEGEKWVFNAEGELADSLSAVASEAVEEILTVVGAGLGLPSVRTIKKSLFNLTWKGKILFHPETGKPIKTSEFDKLIQSIERFLNRKFKDTEKKLVLAPRVLARLLNAMAKKQGTPDAGIRGMKLQDIMQRERSWGAFTSTLGNYSARYKVSPVEADQVFLALSRSAEYVTDMKWKMTKAVKLTLLDGIQQRKSKGEIAQDLFDRLGNCNRDWKRIADTEVADNFNNAFLRMESGKAEPGVKVYFKRVEAFDDHVCKYCVPIRGKIVLWSEAPLSSEKIVDEWTDTAIWEGKSNVGRKAKDYWLTAGPMHPHCRGSWSRWVPPVKGLEKEVAAIETKLADVKTRRRETAARMIAEGWSEKSEGWSAEFRRRMGEGK